MAETNPNVTDQDVLDPNAQATDPNAEPAVQAEPNEAQHDFDKGLQAVQQELANTRRQMTVMMETIARQGGVATPQQAQQVAQVQDDLDLLINASPDQVDPFKTAQYLARTLKQERVQAKQYQEQTNRQLQEMHQQNQQDRATRDRQMFEMKNPDLADKYDTLIQTVQDRLKPYEGDRTAYATASQFVWKEVVAEARSKAPQATGRPQPASSQPPRSTAGTRTMPSGSPSRPGSVKDARAIERELLDALDVRTEE